MRHSLSAALLAGMAGGSVMFLVLLLGGVLLFAGVIAVNQGIADAGAMVISVGPFLVCLGTGTLASSFLPQRSTVGAAAGTGALAVALGVFLLLVLASMFRIAPEALALDWQRIEQGAIGTGLGAAGGAVTAAIRNRRVRPAS